MPFSFTPKKLLAGLTTATFLGLPILAGAYLGPTPSVAVAQSQPPAPAESPEGAQPGELHHHSHHLGRILKSLGLSDDQKTKIHAIMKEARERSRGADQETRRANMKQAIAQIDQVLTPTQRAEFHAKLQAWHQAHPQPEPTS